MSSESKLEMRPCEECGRLFQPSRDGHVVCGRPACVRSRQNKCKRNSAKKATEKRGGVSEAVVSVKDIRGYYGLRPVKSGRIRCRKCGRLFTSEDVLKIKTCMQCKARMAVFLSPEVGMERAF